MPPGRDPAEILQTDGAAALIAACQQSRPLAQVAIDTYLHRWGRQLDHAEGQLAAMRGAAVLIAGTLPEEVADVIRELTGRRKLTTLDEGLRPVINSAFTQIALMLPATAVCQILRVAERTGHDHSDITAEIVNAVAQKKQSPKAGASGEPRDDARPPATRQEDSSLGPGGLADFLSAIASRQGRRSYVSPSKPALQQGRSPRTRR